VIIYIYIYIYFKHPLNKNIVLVNEPKVHILFLIGITVIYEVHNWLSDLPLDDIFQIPPNMRSKLSPEVSDFLRGSIQSLPQIHCDKLQIQWPGLEIMMTHSHLKML